MNLNELWISNRVCRGRTFAFLLGPRRLGNFVGDNTRQEFRDNMLNKQSKTKALAAIPGWLAETAALFTFHIMEAQDRHDIRGPALEIGVYKGKYLALLRVATDDDIVGIELCPGGDAQSAVKEITENVRMVAGHCNNLKIAVENSHNLSERDLLKLLEREPTFIHIDGGHDVDTVFHDLSICAPILKTGGIIAIDDAFNFGIPGVTEAICKFFRQDSLAAPRLAPFAHCYNKLFITTRGYHSIYLEEARAFLDIAPYDVVERTRHRMAENESSRFVPLLFGYEIIPFL